MEQLQLTSFQKGDNRAYMDNFKPYNNILMQWKCSYPDFDDDRGIEIIWNIKIVLKEAVIIKKKKRLAGFRLLVLVSIKDKTGDLDIDSFIHEAKDFEDKDRQKGIEEYASWCASVWLQWRIIAESRAQNLSTSDRAYLCPFCGFASKSSFDWCRGCGKRFWTDS